METEKKKTKQNKEKRSKDKTTARGIFPKKSAYKLLLIVMGLVAAGLLSAMILVNTFPPDLTILVIVAMAVLFLLTSIMLSRGDRWKRVVGIVLSLVFIGVFGAATYYLGSTYAMMAKISSDSEFSNAGGVRTGNPSEEAFNVYLTGIDQWEAEKGGILSEAT